MESSAGTPEVIWTRDSYDIAPFVSFSSLPLYYLADLGTSLHLRFSSQLHSHLSQATRGSHCFTGTQRKHSINKESEIVGSCEPDLQPKKSLCVDSENTQ